MTTNSNEFLNSDDILSLEDKFVSTELDILTDKALFNPETVIEIKAEASSMPHVLVDDQLMAEIATIPDRFGFKIGDVADLLGIKQYVLRYWEQEFDLLKPKKASNNQRLYTKKDVENAFLIRKLLYRDKFSIEGARQALKDVKFAFKKEKDFNLVIQKIDLMQVQIRNFADEIHKVKKLFI
ncbi:MAG: MerR family transcriptional regulator [Pseudobdellovibrio sp.]